VHFREHPELVRLRLIPDEGPAYAVLIEIDELPLRHGLLAARNRLFGLLTLQLRRQRSPTKPLLILGRELALSRRVLDKGTRRHQSRWDRRGDSIEDNVSESIVHLRPPL